MRLDQHGARTPTVIVASLALAASLFRLGYLLAHPKETR